MNPADLEPHERLAYCAHGIALHFRPGQWDEMAERTARDYYDYGPGLIPAALLALEMVKEAPLEPGDGDIGWLAEARPHWSAEKRGRWTDRAAIVLLQMVGRHTAQMRDGADR